ncbi:MAG: DUF5309 family protein [Planctomycetota bacterium]|nr:DUF5309 family protein [Planctomycetota bacterium]
MADAYLQGIQLSESNQPEIRNDIFVVTTNWFVNRCPLVTRVPRAPAGSTTFTLVSRHFRPRSVSVAAAVAATDTVINLLDASWLMNGDVLALVSGERVEIQSDPNLTLNQITVRRGVEGTTPATGSVGDVLQLIGNSRTGAEIDQSGIALAPIGVSQFCQTWQHPVQVGGSLQASRAFQTSSGVRTPFDQTKMDALQNLMDDMESTSYYGLGDDPAVALRPKQKGLRTLIQTNKTTAPVNAGMYRATDFIRDTLQACRQNGGDPDVLLLSSNFMTGLATWGQAVQRIDAGVNIFGTPINVFEAPFLGGVSIIEAPLLKPYSAACLTSSEVRLRMKRNEFWNPRGTRGDAFEGDWIAEGAIELENEMHHAWVEGITAFSA